jgi:hypothetical protein
MKKSIPKANLSTIIFYLSYIYQNNLLSYSSTSFDVQANLKTYYAETIKKHELFILKIQVCLYEIILGTSHLVTIDFIIMIYDNQNYKFILLVFKYFTFISNAVNLRIFD